MRKSLAHAFSHRSLTEQGDIIQSIIDLFVERLQGFADHGEIFDIVMWFNMLTFDIIGDLAFGENFGGVQSGTMHPWISRITGAMTQGALADCFKRFPFVAKIVMTLAPGAITKAIADTKINEKYSIDLIRKRIASETKRKDFITPILDNREGEEAVPDIQMAAHASDFVLAGSETTATALACIVYYLFKTPDATEKLCEEIRGRFDKFEDIDAATTSSLEFLNATILEGLRIYPPLPFALPRVVPLGGASVDGYELAANVRISVC